MRKIASFAVLVALVACSSGRAAEPATRAVAVPSSPAFRDAAPQVRMSVGTDSMPGALSLWCRDGACRRRSAARPARYLPSADSGLVIFATGVVPTAARVVVRRPGGAVVSAGFLQPGTTMAYRADIPAGRFLVTLIETWSEREARWVFGLQGPGGTP